MRRIDGRVCDQVSAADRGLNYGDGVFTTLKLIGGRPVFWARHYARLRRDAARLRLTCPEEAAWLEDILALAADHGDGAIKCLLTRGVGGRGYRPEPERPPTRIVAWSPLPVYPSDWREKGGMLRVCGLRLGAQPALAGVKHLNRLENVLARMEWTDPELAEGLLLDQDDRVVEGTQSNVFWRLGDAWETPSLERAGVAGVLRGWVMETLAARGRPVAEVRAGLGRVLEADEVFVCNSLLGILSARRLLDRDWADFSGSSALRRALREDEHAV